MKRKCENLSYEELLNIAENFFLEELKRFHPFYLKDQLTILKNNKRHHLQISQVLFFSKV